MDKKQGWIQFVIEKPPVNEDIILLIPNPVYGNHCFADVGQLISPERVKTSSEKELSIISTDFYHASHWAYTEQKEPLPNICTCEGCRPDIYDDMIKQRLKLANDYAIAAGETKPETFIEWIKKNCGYKHNIIYYRPSDKTQLDRIVTDEQLYELFKQNPGAHSLIHAG